MKRTALNLLAAALFAATPVGVYLVANWIAEVAR
jgi:hypothetical protein